MRLVDAHSDIEVIERRECVSLLKTQELGRIAFSAGGVVEILPVNYVVDGEAVVFATAPGAKLTYAEGRMVTFEVDDADAASRSGWSVIIHGDAHEVTSFDAPELLQRLRSLPPHPWAAGDRTHLVRVAARTITGRRIRPHE